MTDHRDVIERAASRLMEVYGEDGPTGTDEQIDEAIGGALLLLGEVTSLSERNVCKAAMPCDEPCGADGWCAR